MPVGDDLLSTYDRHGPREILSVMGETLPPRYAESRALHCEFKMPELRWSHEVEELSLAAIIDGALAEEELIILHKGSKISLKTSLTHIIFT
jgi:hypothetical protein